VVPQSFNHVVFDEIAASQREFGSLDFDREFQVGGLASWKRMQFGANGRHIAARGSLYWAVWRLRFALRQLLFEKPNSTST